MSEGPTMHSASPERERLDQMWDALWEDLRHNATGRPSGLIIIAAHRRAIEAAAGGLTLAPQPASDSAALREALALTRRNLQGILMAAHAAARRDHPENDDWPLGMALVEAHVVWEFDRRAALQAAAPPSAPQHWTCECGHGEEDHYFACVHHDSGCAVTITDAPQSAPDGEPSRED